MTDFIDVELLRRRSKGPFLLLTHGGIAALESLLATNKTIRF